MIFTILEARYPDKDPIDRAGKALFDVFEVSAREGERLGEWSARADSVFHACQRDAGIVFPDMVKGYLCLHRCGLSDDQRAVLLGRTGGQYEVAAMLDTGHENNHRNVCRATQEVDEVATQRGKTSFFSKKTGRETHFCDWSPQQESRFLCFFESKHCSLLVRIRKRREQRCSLLEKAKKQKIDRERAIGECEAMLNSSPGKGIIDTGCAKMMMGSDTFKQYLDLLTSKERASVEKVREKNRFRFGDNETRMSHWSAVIPMHIGKHVCREKVAILLGGAPFLISKPFLQRMGAVLDLVKGQVSFSKLGVTMNLGSSTGHCVTDLISDCEILTIAPGSVIKH